MIRTEILAHSCVHLPGVGIANQNGTLLQHITTDITGVKIVDHSTGVAKGESFIGAEIMKIKVKLKSKIPSPVLQIFVCRTEILLAVG